MTSTDDLFKQPSRSAFPKMDDLDGKLVLIKPSKIETVPGYQNKGTVDRLTADVVVFNEDGTTDEYEDMYLSQVGIVGACRSSLKPGGKPFVLGRIDMFPTKNNREKYPTSEAIRKAQADWIKGGGKGEKPQMAWGLAEFKDGDADKARAYLASKDPFTTA